MISSNSARRAGGNVLGGGIFNDSSGNAALSGNTLRGNSAYLDGGILNWGSIVVRNTIFANK